METQWDYTALAHADLKRSDYADAAIDAMLAITGARRKDKICDVEAGVAHLIAGVALLSPRKPTRPAMAA